MFLCHNNGSGLDGGSKDCGLVERLDCRDIDHISANAFSLKCFRGFQSFPNHVAGGDDSHVLTLVKNISLADFEGLIGHEVSHFGPAETEIDGTVILGSRDCGVFGLGPVTRVDHDHVGKSAHQGDVLHRLVGGSVLSEGDSRM